MFKLPDANTVFFDVDGTLILHDVDCPPELMEAEGIPIVRKFGNGTIREFFVPHQTHINLLKEFKEKGKVIVVWSQGGSDWCELVVHALGIVPWVDLIVNKPAWWVDDVPACYFVPATTRIYKTYDGRTNT